MNTIAAFQPNAVRLALSVCLTVGGSLGFVGLMRHPPPPAPCFHAHKVAVGSKLNMIPSCIVHINLNKASVSRARLREA